MRIVVRLEWGDAEMSGTRNNVSAMEVYMMDLNSDC